MPREWTKLFDENPELQKIEVTGHNDGQPYGLSSDGRKLRICDYELARDLANIPGADSGHTTEEGYYVRGAFIINEDSYRASAHRRPPA